MFDVNGEFFAVLPLLISLLYIIPHLDRIWRQMQLFFYSTFFTILCIARKLHENGDKLGNSGVYVEKF